MSYRISSKIGVDRLLDYATAAGAALHASEETRDLAPQWFSLADEVDGHIADRRKSHRKTTIARALVRVADVRWDSTFERVADKAWMLSGKNRKRAPYEPLFGDVTASQLKDYGAQRAIAFGEDFEKRLVALKNPELMQFVDEVREANEKLKQADEDRKVAVREERMHQFPRLALVEKTQVLVNKTEIALLSRFPGNRELVRAVLSPTPTTRRRRRVAAQQAAQSPSMPPVPPVPPTNPLPNEARPPRQPPVPPEKSSVQPAESEASPYRTDVSDDEEVVID